MIKVSLFIAFVLITFVCCKSEKEKPECPYQEIIWSHSTQTTDSMDKKNFSIDFGGAIEGYLKKLGKGKLNGEIKYQFDDYSRKITNSNIDIDSFYVQNWNALVQDICGSLSLLTYPTLSDSSKHDIENGLLSKVKNFYEIVTRPNKNSMLEKAINSNSFNKSKEFNRINEIKQKSQVEPEKLEISIQLEDSKGGYLKAFLNGKEISPLPSSTKDNPRISVISNANIKQEIIIVTRKLDTCLVNSIFDIKEKESFPIRFIPTCK
jgi:hypothetical protein